MLPRMAKLMTLTTQTASKEGVLYETHSLLLGMDSTLRCMQREASVLKRKEPSSHEKT